MDPINEAYQQAANQEKIEEGKNLDWQKVWNKRFKMKIGDTISNKVEGNEPGEKVWYYTNFDYTILDMWLEAHREGDEVKFEVMVKVKRQNHGDKDTAVLSLKDLDDGNESFESNVNYPNG